MNEKFNFDREATILFSFGLEMNNLFSFGLEMNKNVKKKERRNCSAHKCGEIPQGEMAV